MTKDEKTRAMRAVRSALTGLYLVVQDGIDKGNQMGDLEAKVVSPIDRIFAELMKLPTED